MMKYVVLSANNDDTDISIDGPYKTRREARIMMKNSFDCFEGLAGEWNRNEDAISFYDGSSLYYAVVKPVKL